MVNAPTKPRPAPPAPVPDPYAKHRSTRYLDVLLDVGFATDRILEKRLGGLSLSTAQLRLIEIIGQHEPIQPGKLAALMLQQSQSVSGLLNRLEDRGLVSRDRESKEDRRNVYVSLTAVGREVLADGTKIRDGFEAELLTLEPFDLIEGRKTDQKVRALLAFRDAIIPLLS